MKHLSLLLVWPMATDALGVEDRGKESDAGRRITQD